MSYWKQTEKGIMKCLVALSLKTELIIYFETAAVYYYCCWCVVIFVEL